MNTSQFMDKQQIMDLSSSSPPSTDFIHLLNNNNNTTTISNSHDQKQQQQIGGDHVLGEILPSYDFHPIRPHNNTTVSLSNSALDLAGSSASRVCSASDSLNQPDSTLSSNKGLGSLDSVEPTKLVPDKGHNLLNTTILSEIDRTMKKHADTLLQVMDGVSERLTHLETRTHNLEKLVDDLKVSVDKSHGSSDGKMRQLQHILVEVQSGVQLIKDKHEIFEAQLQLSKLQVSKADQHPKTHSLHVDPTAQSSTPVTQQQIPQFPHTSFPQTPSSSAALSQQSLQPPSSHQSLQPPSSQLLAQLPTLFSPQQEPYCPPPSLSQPSPPDQLPYQAPPQTQPPHQPPYQSPPQQPQYPQQPPPPPPPPSGYIPEEHPSYAVQSYSPNPPRQQLPAGYAPSQQFHNAPQPQPSMYDGAGGRSSSSFPSGYSPESYPYTGPPMASAKPPYVNGSRTGYPQLSNSRPLPHTLPMAAAAVSSGSSSPRSESRVPIDDVIDRVTTMGFPRDQVRATVRKLTENGQAVDLNVVLDKLMNEGGGAWFGGR